MFLMKLAVDDFHLIHGFDSSWISNPPALLHCFLTLHKKATIHQVTTMLATSKNVLFPGHNHLLTTGADDPTFWLSPERQRVKGHQYRWLAGGYDLEIGLQLKWLTWWLPGA